MFKLLLLTLNLFTQVNYGGPVQDSTSTSNLNKDNTNHPPSSSTGLVWESNNQYLYGTQDFIINEKVEGYQDKPSVDVFSNGDYVITWRGPCFDANGHANSSYAIYAQVFDRTHSLLVHDILVSTCVDNSDIGSDVTTLPNDEFVVVWYTFFNTEYHILGARYSKYGVPKSNPKIFEVHDSPASTQTQPSIDSFRNGTFVVIWQVFQLNGTLSYGLVGQRFYPNNTKLGHQFQVNNYPRVFSPQTGANVATFSNKGYLYNDGFIVAFQGYDNPDGHDPDEAVYTRVFDQNAKKLSLFQVNSMTLDYQTASSIDTFPNNDMVVVWQDQLDGSGGIVVQPLPEDQLITKPSFIANTYVGKQKNPNVATFDNHQYVVGWRSENQNNMNHSVHAQMMSATSEKIGEEFLIPNTPTGNQRNLQLATIDEYQFLAVWEENRKPGHNQTDIVARIFFLVTLPLTSPKPTFPPSAWEVGNQALYRLRSPFIINSYTAGNQYYPSIDCMNDTYYLFWEGTSKTGRGCEVYGQYLKLYNNTIGEEINATSLSLLTDSTISTASFIDGGYIVAFSNISHTFIQGKRNNITFSPLIVSTEGKINTRPNIVSRSDGNALITWASGDTLPTLGIKGRFITANFTLAKEEFVINNYTSRQDFPQTALFSDDSFVTVWISFNQDTSSSIGIFGQRFDANGVPISHVFQVNSYTKNDQNNPRVAAFKDDGFVVTWDSVGQDNGNIGVYGQLFDAHTKLEGSEFQVHTSTGDLHSDPYVTTLPHDQFLVGWETYDPSSLSSKIVGQLFSRNGNKIGPSFPVTATTPESQSQVAIATFPSQEILFVYTQTNGDGNRDGILGQFWKLSTPIPTLLPTPTPTMLNQPGQPISKKGGQLLINTVLNSTQKNADIGTFSDGRHIVVWEDSSRGNNSQFGIYAQFLSPEGRWEGIQLHITKDIEEGDQRSPKVAVNKNDNTFMVVWRSMTQNNHVQGIYERLFDRNKNSISLDLVSRTVTPLQSSPQVAHYPKGQFIITWHTTCTSLLDYFGNPIPACPFLFKYRIVASMHEKNGKPFTREIVIKESNDSSIHAETALATISADTAVVVWRTRDAIVGRRIINNGTLLGDEFEVVNTTGLAYQRPDITTSSDGGFIVTFLETVKGQILGQRFYPNATKKGSIFTVDSTQVTLDLLSVKPSISSFEDEKFFISFHANFNNHTNIYGQLFDTPQNQRLKTVSNLTLINSYTSGTQQNPISTTFGNTTLLVVWDGEGPYGIQDIWGQMMNITTESPTILSTQNPSQNATLPPTGKPSLSPFAPTDLPTLHSTPPTQNPTTTPSSDPSDITTLAPSLPPFSLPSTAPSNHPSDLPSQNPSLPPSDYPTHAPTTTPTAPPFTNPSSHAPTHTPFLIPISPSTSPTTHPTPTPSLSPLLPSSSMSIVEWLQSKSYTPIWAPIVGLASLFGLGLCCLKKE